jgi:hypothetical protein
MDASPYHLERRFDAGLQRSHALMSAKAKVGSAIERLRVLHH